MADYTLPDNLCLSNVTLTQEIPTFTNESISKKVTSKTRGIHRFSGSIDVTIGDLIDQRAYFAFLAKCQGRSSTFEVDLPLHFKSSDISFNPINLNPINVGDISFQISAGFTGTIYAGTFFNMPNDDKTYVVTEDCISGGTLTFFPAMRNSHLARLTIEILNPVLTVRFNADNQEVDLGESGFVVTTTIDWTEAL